MEASDSAFKHGVAADDIDHAIRNTMAVDDWDDDLRLYLGPSRDGDDRIELVIHAMPMREKYRKLLPEG